MTRGNEFAAINTFNGGTNTDFDEHSIKSNQYEYLLNGDISFKNGYGIISNKSGNTFQFKLTPGFRPLTSATHRGISYIISYNPTTSEGEIGCFPAPNAYLTHNISLTGFSRLYAPLFNFTGAFNNQFAGQTRLDFRTTLFNFSMLNHPKIRLREDYDKTVNIYFCDGLNPDRVINSGFHQETGAVVTQRCYGDNSFPCVVELLNESPLHPVISSVDLRTGGSLKAGTYKVFARYTTYDYNPTSFLSETNMLMVTDIDGDDDISTTATSTKHGTSQLIEVQYTSLDPAYNFLEVGYVRYFESSYETVILDKRYPIVAGAATVLITGTEKVFNVDSTVFTAKKSNLKISKTITDLDERLFRGNLKRLYSHHDDLAIFALAITAKEDFAPIGNKTLSNANTISGYGMYKRWQNVYNLTGYFSCEPYPFGIVFVFTDGTESDSYPITGKDRYALDNTSNSTGIFRFPDHFNRTSPIYDSAGNVSYAMGIKFDMTAAN